MPSFLNILVLLATSASFVSGQKASTTAVDEQFQPLLSITDQNAVGGKIYTTCNAQKKWAMTYDDGPALPTNTLLDMLDKKGIKATFFVVGEMVQENPDILKDAFNRGHEIGVHTWSHPHLNTLGNAQVIQQAKSTYDIIKNTIGQGPLLIRPPYGEANKRVSEILTKMGFIVVNWNVDSGDASFGAAGVIGRIQSQLPSYDRGIVLEHDLEQSFVDQAEGVVKLVQAKGPNFVHISDCLGVTPYGNLGGSGQQQGKPISVTVTKPIAAATLSATVTSVATKVTQPSGAPTATKTSAAVNLIANHYTLAFLAVYSFL